MTACWGALALFLGTIPLTAQVRGRVEDGAGRPVEGARIAGVLPSGAAAASTRSAADGTWELPTLGPGSAIRVEHAGFETREVRAAAETVVALHPAALASRVTVTAVPGLAEEASTAPEHLYIARREDLAVRPNPTLGHLLEEAPGILVQQTTPGQVSPFLRGLTGYQVLNLVDGVRFNNSTFRSGPNQYLAYLEPSQASRVEAMPGPSGTQYGSDGLGGTIQVLTTPARLSDGPGWTRHGEWNLSGDSQDLGGGTSGEFGAGNERLWLLLGGNWHRHNDQYTGEGADSRHALRRFFNLENSLIHEIAGTRLRDTAWTRASVHGKMAYRPSERYLFSGFYQHGALLGVRGYKDLWGGLGRLQSGFAPQTLDFLYARWEGLRLSKFDSVSARFSLNRQTDGGQRQNLRATDPVTREENRVRALGLGGQAATHFSTHTVLSVHGESYFEAVGSERTRDGAPQRPLYPDGSTYRTSGVAAHGATEMVGRRLRAGYGLRYSHIHYANPAQAAYNLPASAQSFADWTWNASLQWRLNSAMALHAAGGRGFRAPNLNDLGALGLNDLGYEIPVREALDARPLLANSAAEGALSKGVPARALGVETLMNVEAGWRLALARLEARVQVFNAQLEDPIVRRTLLFDRASSPSSLAGIPVTVIQPTAAQAAQGVVTVATPFDPRAVKAFVNDGRAVYRGLESYLRYRVDARWSVRAAYSFLGGHEMDPNRNVRRLPPQMGHAALRYDAAGRGWWLEAAVHAAGAQERLSGGDLDDERIGASRSRRDIADFFHGARIAPYVDAAGRFTPTGETLAQIQQRVLPGLTAETLRIPMYTSTAGWAAVELRGGFPLAERWTLMGSVANLANKNYRVHGSGIDGPGRSAFLTLRFLF